MNNYKITLSDGSSFTVTAKNNAEARNRALAYYKYTLGNCSDSIGRFSCKKEV